MRPKDSAGRASLGGIPQGGKKADLADKILSVVGGDGLEVPREASDVMTHRPFRPEDASELVISKFWRAARRELAVLKRRML